MISQHQSFDMESKVKAHLSLFELLATSAKLQATAIIKMLSRDQMSTICEGILNIRYGNVPLGDADKTKLHWKRSVIRKLTMKTVGHKLWRQLIEKEIPLIIFISKLLLSIK